jgi:polyphosphate kinase
MAVSSATSGASSERPSYADDLAEELEEPEESAPAASDGWPPDRYLDRQLSWLDFNERVLELAADSRVPLLERIRFVAIFAQNLDEFFMVRVAGLKRRIATGIAVTTPGGLSPKDRLDRVLHRAHELVADHGRLFREELVPALESEGIRLLTWEELTEIDRLGMQSLFRDRIYPVLTPLAVDPAHPFPYISGLSLNLAVVVRDRDAGREHFARVKVPELLPRFIHLDSGRFVPLEEVISAQLPELFPGMDVLEWSTFRVTRNEDVELEEEEDVENLLAALERELMRRRFGVPVRLEVDVTTSDHVLELLTRELDVAEPDVFRIAAPLDLSGLGSVAELDRPELTYDPFVPASNAVLSQDESTDRDIFAVLRLQDVLVHHPYDSFATSVQEFIEQAAADPGVLAIKQTLYRTSGDSPIVDALIDAAQAGKQVLVLVEIKARFDEQANIRWARTLEQAGCHVVYGLVGLKTHCKLSLVVREEEGGTLRRYAHIGTGNYNPKTARIYEDFGLLTSDPAVCEDVADLFNHLSGYTKHAEYRTLLVAPDTLRSGLLELIEEQRRRALAGREALIRMKLNSLVDERLIDALYAASTAGVTVDLLVRGMCSLRPGVPGMSDRIRVRSVLGRFLEHSRVLQFGPPGEDELWIGSADLMHRNLDRRVEALVRVSDDAGRRYLTAVLDLAMSPRVSAWELHADGRWLRVDLDESGEPLLDLQEQLINSAAQRPVLAKDMA